MDTDQMGRFFVSIEIGKNDKTVVIFAHVNLAVLPTRLIRRRVTPRTRQIEIGISERRKVNLDPISRYIERRTCSDYGLLHFGHPWVYVLGHGAYPATNLDRSNRFWSLTVCHHNVM